MCLQREQTTRQSRILVSVGCFCLALGLSLHNFAHPSTQTGRDWLDGVSGTLLGVAIAFNLFALRLARSSRVKAPNNL